jgi:heme/copper-type cytochrome/quinol oxidase subunit 2
VHVIILWICASLAAVVFGVMLYSIAAFRKPPDAATPYRHNKLVEILWAIVPIVILVGMATPAVKALMLIDQARQSALCAPQGWLPRTDVKKSPGAIFDIAPAMARRVAARDGGHKEYFS